MKNKYALLFKTGESEIRALRNFSNKKGLFPIVELTRGRRTKNDTIGEIQKRIDQIRECFQGLELILDLTTEPALSSKQIDTLYEPGNGYEQWVNFMREIKSQDCFRKIYPAILANVDDDDFDNNLRKQIESLQIDFDGIAYRCNIEDEGYVDDINIIRAALNAQTKFFFIVDCGFIKNNDIESCENKAINVINTVKEAIPQTIVILSSTSFPDKIGDVDADTMPLYEISLYKRVTSKLSSIVIVYSDYGSINPVRNDNVRMPNGWRPRIDVPLKTEIYYNRKRRLPAGYSATYSLVANDCITDTRFPSELSKNWGVQQIVNAANDAAPGSSPSFWISVRMNIYIEQQIKRMNL